MLELDLHCKINEELFSWVIFVIRLLVAGVLTYIAVGSLLYYRDFLYNAAALGYPMPVVVGLCLLAGQLLLALLLVLGWCTRLVAGLCVLCSAAAGIAFFAGDINKIYVALLVLLITALLAPALLGPGKISLDYKQALRRATKEFRG